MASTIVHEEVFMAQFSVTTYEYPAFKIADRLIIDFISRNLSLRYKRHADFQRKHFATEFEQLSYF